MNLIDLNCPNHFFIFGNKNTLVAGPLLKELKSKEPGYKYYYISVTGYGAHKGMILTSLNDSMEVTNANFEHSAFFKNLSRELFKIIQAHARSFEIKLNVTLVFNNFLDIDSAMQDRLLTADFSSSLPDDISRETLKIAGKTVKDVDLFHSRDLHEFDNFVTRMTNFKSGTVENLANIANFYSRFLS